MPKWAALITAEHRAKVTGYIDSGGGRRRAVGGGWPALSVPGCEQGFGLGGTLFDHVTPEMTIYRENLWPGAGRGAGGQLRSRRCNWINDHPYGNGASLFTRDGATARAFAHRAGRHGWGEMCRFRCRWRFASFGGWKSSLFGDQHVHGMEGCALPD